VNTIKSDSPIVARFETPPVNSCNQGETLVVDEAVLTFSLDTIRGTLPPPLTFEHGIKSRSCAKCP
jgi:hypothetical protein